MALSRQALSDYDAALSRVERAAADYVRRRVDAYMASYPDASVADVRDFAIGVISDAVDAYGDAASAAADLYDELAEASPKTLPTATVDTSDVSGYVDKEVRYQAGKLVGGAPTEFVRQVALCASDQVARRGNATMRLNASRDGIRWARVPMGGETCTFCAMLASRGFVYRSAKTAGQGDHWHRNCRCKVVPETAGSVEGYDPEEWYGRWREMRAIDADPRLTVAQKLEAKGRLYGFDSSRTDALSSFLKTIAPSLDDAVSNSNRTALFDSMDPRYRRNCQRCVVAAELRRRGYDVVALGRVLDGPDEVARNWRDLFKGCEWKKTGGKAGTDSAIRKMPLGARGTVYIVWKKKRGERGYSAHVFNFERTGNGVVYYDSQSGNHDVSFYFKLKSKRFPVEIARTDNLEVNGAFIKEVVEEAGE